MKKLVASSFLFFLMATSAVAEIKRINITIFGMDREVCAHAVRVSLKDVPGVDTVDVSLEKGLATVKMKPGNTTTLRQLNDAIAKNGFTMKDSMTTVAGTVVTTNGKTVVQVSGSNDVLVLVPESSGAIDAASFSGKSVLVEGMIPEANKGKAPDTIHYRSITEGKGTQSLYNLANDRYC